MNSKGVEIPLNEESISPFNYVGDAQFLQAIGLMLFGFFIILFLEKIGKKNKHS